MVERDTLQRFVFTEFPVRGEFVRLGATWEAVTENRNYPPVVRRLLGETMVAGALLAATLKFNGSLILQIQGNGPVPLLVVECTSERTLRGLAHWHEPISEGSLRDVLGDGNLVITIDPQDEKSRYQSVVNLEGDSIATVLESYLAQSEQISTRLWIASNDKNAAGLMLQRVPGESTDDDDAWERTVHLSQTVSESELLRLPSEELLYRLFHEESVRVFDHEPVSFRCTCSREKVRNMLRAFGHDEVQSILADEGKISVNCEFCNQLYEFDSVDAAMLFVDEVSPEVPPTTH